MATAITTLPLPTYLQIEPPTRTVETWVFEGRPHLDAVETVELQESNGVTTMTIRLTYRDKASRDEDMKSNEDIQGESSGQQQSFDKLEDLLGELLIGQGVVPGNRGGR